MYNAIISKLENVQKVIGSDFIQLAQCNNFNVIVGLEAKNGQEVVLFIDDGQLSEQFCYENSLFNKPELNKDTTRKGFFSDKRRVKAQTFRGVRSEAFTIGLNSLSYTGYDVNKLKVGDMFNELNGICICNKYFTEKTLSRISEKKFDVDTFGKKELKLIFPEHTDTDQFRFATNEAIEGLVILTEKIHGTSGRSSYQNVPKQLPLKWYQELWNVFVDEAFHGPKHLFNFWFKDADQIQGLKFYPTKREWVKMFATRRVIKGEAQEKSDYRTLAHNMISPFMQKNEVWYYEIVGYEKGEGGSPIMQPIQLTDFPKEIKKQFNSPMFYKYGCVENEFDVYVYRICIVNEDGVKHDLPWDEVRMRCKEANLKTPPELYRTYIHNNKYNDVDNLREEVENYTNMNFIASTIDKSHFIEGVCIRIEHSNGKMKVWKNKGYLFKFGEGLLKDLDGYIDTEEIEG